MTCPVNVSLSGGYPDGRTRRRGQEPTEPPQVRGISVGFPPVLPGPFVPLLHQPRYNHDPEPGATLRDEWRRAGEARQSAEAEAAAASGRPSDALPAVAAGMAAERHDLWTQTAARRAELAAEQTGELARLAEQAARDYA